jgi:hypothetical protein
VPTVRLKAALIFTFTTTLKRTHFIYTE